MDTQTEPLPPLRRRLFWLLLIFVPYLLSFLWLSGYAVVIYAVFYFAPMGFISLFDPTFRADDFSRYRPVLRVVHAIFWPTYFAALFGAKKLPLSVLRVIFVCLALVLVMTCYGCARHYYTAPGKM